MANLNDGTDVFPDVYQIETTDPVLGGTPNPGTGDGLTNIPHLQLAQRTRWLRTRVDQLLAAVVAASTTVAGIVRLNNSTGSTSTTEAATANAVRIANENANGRLSRAANLADLDAPQVARANLGLGTMAQADAGTADAQHRTNAQNDGRFLRRDLNLGDLASPPAARANLGLGSMAVTAAGTGAAQFRTNEQNDGRFARLDQNLVDLPDKAAGRTALDVAQRQSGLSDTTAGRGLVVGAFGLGGFAPRASSDLNAEQVSGWVEVTEATLNRPSGLTAGLVRVDARTAGRAAQTCYAVNNNVAVRIWVRFFGVVGGTGSPVWTAWEEVLHTGNLGALVLGVAQSWQSVTGSRVWGTAYQNTTGRPIQIAIVYTGNQAVQVSPDNATWVSVLSPVGGAIDGASVVIPPGHWYRIAPGGSAPTITSWAELR